jgi:hypothetical protein
MFKAFAESAARQYELTRQMQTIYQALRVCCKSYYFEVLDKGDLRGGRALLLKDTSFINLPVFIRGKLEMSMILGDALLIVVTDRISAFDVVFDELIPDKGIVLNSYSSVLV